jgi:WD40 repeat protein
MNRRSAFRALALLGLLPLATFVCASPPAAEARPVWNLKETVLSTDLPEAEGRTLIYSRDARHAACARTVEGRTTLQIDGTSVPITGTLKGLALSPNGRRLAFSVATRGEERLVLDGRRSEAFTRILTNSFAFSPNSRRFGCLAFRDGNLIAVLEATNSPPDVASGVPASPMASDQLPDGPNPPLVQFSADAQHVAHLGLTNAQFHVVHDGRAGPAFSTGIGGLTLSADGRRLAYVGVEGSEQMLVLDGKVIARSFHHEAFNSSVFSPDSRRFAYSVRGERGWTLCLDGQESEPYEAFGSASARFSPDGKRVAFAAVSRSRWSVVVDGRESAESYASVATRYTPLFSPDSKRLAYCASRDGQWFLVVDGEKSPVQWPRIGSVAFSPDSRWLAYMARPREGWVLVVEGKPSSEAYYTVSHIVFDSPTRLHFIAERHAAMNEHHLLRVEATRIP